MTLGDDHTHQQHHTSNHNHAIIDPIASPTASANINMVDATSCCAAAKFCVPCKSSAVLRNPLERANIKVTTNIHPVWLGRWLVAAQADVCFVFSPCISSSQPPNTQQVHCTTTTPLQLPPSLKHTKNMPQTTPSIIIIPLLPARRPTSSNPNAHRNPTARTTTATTLLRVLLGSMCGRDGSHLPTMSPRANTPTTSTEYQVPRDGGGGICAWWGYGKRVQERVCSGDAFPCSSPRASPTPRMLAYIPYNPHVGLHPLHPPCWLTHL